MATTGSVIGRHRGDRGSGPRNGHGPRLSKAPATPTSGAIAATDFPAPGSSGIRPGRPSGPASHRGHPRLRRAPRPDGVRHSPSTCCNPTARPNVC